MSSGCYSDLFPCSVGHAGQEKLRTITSSSAYYLGAHGSIAFAESLGMNFLETSAKESINVVTAFLTMSSEIKKRMTSQSAMERKSIVHVHMKGQPIQQEKAVAPLHKLSNTPFLRLMIYC